MLRSRIKPGTAIIAECALKKREETDTLADRPSATESALEKTSSAIVIFLAYKDQNPRRWNLHD